MTDGLLEKLQASATAIEALIKRAEQAEAELADLKQKTESCCLSDSTTELCDPIDDSDSEPQVQGGERKHHGKRTPFV